MRQPANPRRRVLFLTPGRIDRQTGGSLYNRHVVKTLAASGFIVEVLSLPDLAYIPALGSSLIIGPWLFFRVWPRKYSVIIQDAWLHPSLFVFNLLCRLASRPLIMIVHQLRSLEDNRISELIARSVERSALRAATLLVTVSEYMRTEIEQLIGEHVETIVAAPGISSLRNGTSNSDIARGDNTIRLLSVGNCIRRKGLHHLIQAMTDISDLPLCLDLVGSCSVEPRYYRQLCVLIENAGLAGRVLFHGQVSEAQLNRFYSNADIFVLSSVYEGYGIVLTEAMCAGLPIVATDIGPTREVVGEDDNALLIPPGDSRALAGAIRRVATDRQLRHRLCERSTQRARALPNREEGCLKICRSVERICEPDSIQDSNDSR